jgi:hypothetical protein
MIQLNWSVTDGEAQKLIGVFIGDEGHVKVPGSSKTLCGEVYERKCPHCKRDRDLVTFKQRNMLENHLDCGDCAKWVEFAAGVKEGT